MSTPATGTRRASSALVALVTSFLVAVSGLFVVPAAHAAPAGDAISNATLDWGVVAGWRNYIAGTTGGPNIGATAGTHFTAPASESPQPYRWGTAGGGSYDSEARTGTVNGQGAVQWDRYHGALAIQLTLSNVTVDFDLAAGSGQLYADYADPVRDVSGTHALLANLSIPVGAVTDANGRLEVQGAGATATPLLNDVFGGNYSELDPVSFSFDYEEPAPAQATATTATATPDTVEYGQEVVLEAAVAPVAAGKVAFSEGDTALGTADVDIATGKASVSVSSLGLGAHTITAIFTPDAPTAFLGSQGTASVTVEAPDTAAPTTTVLTAPATGTAVLKGSAVALSAKVTNAVDADVIPVGKVEFFSTAVGGSAVSRGSADLDGTGVASLTTADLPAGGNTFEARFTPQNPSLFASSTGSLASNYNLGVVDTAAAQGCTIPDTAVSSEVPASASWGWSKYLNDVFGPARTASGDVSVDGATHVFGNGTVRATSSCAEIAFSGTARVTLHGDNYVEIIDPRLRLSSDGTAVWQAKLVSDSSRNPVGAPIVTSDHVTIATGTASGAFAPGQAFSGSIEFAFADTTAAGTWNGSYKDAWANSFLWNIDSQQRGYYFRSAANANNDKKGALPLTVAFTWPKVSAMSLAASPAGSAAKGADVTLTATVTPAAAEGSVQFFTTPAGGTERSLGTATTTGGVASLTTDALEAGGHTFRSVFTSSNGFAASEAATTGNYGVIDLTEASQCVVGGEHSTVYGVTARWNWSAYAADWAKFVGGNVALDGQTFVLSKGVATVSDDCTRIAFTGSLRVEAYQSFFPTHGQWVELVDPVLTLDEDGNGAWSAGVRTGSGELNDLTSARTVVASVSGAPVPDFAEQQTAVDVPLAYAATTAPGTWAVKTAGSTTTAFGDAWSNAFVAKVPSSIRSFYYASGAAGDTRKAPATIALGHAQPAVSVTGATVSGGALSISASASGVALRSAAQNADTGKADLGVYFALVERGGFDRLSEDDPGIAATFAMMGGTATSVSATVKVAAADRGKLNRSKSYEIVAWRAHGDASAERYLGKADVTLTSEQWDALAAGGNSNTPAPKTRAAGSLVWGISTGFVDYVRGDIAKGSVSTVGVGGGRGGYVFPQATGGSWDFGSQTGTVRYSGVVTFTGHGGLLSETFANPVISVSNASSGTISSSGRSYPLNLAAGSRTVNSDGSVTWRGVPVDGVISGGGGGGGGSLGIDPVTFTVGSVNTVNFGSTTLSNPSTARTPAASPPATTGIDLVTSEDELVSGGEIEITASGFQPNEDDILVVIYSEPTVLDTNAKADADGVVRWIGTLPEDLHGEHTLTLQGSINVGKVLKIMTPDEFKAAQAKKKGAAVEKVTAEAAQTAGPVVSEGSSSWVFWVGAIALVIVAGGMTALVIAQRRRSGV